MNINSTDHNNHYTTINHTKNRGAENVSLHNNEIDHRDTPRESDHYIPIKQETLINKLLEAHLPEEVIKSVLPHIERAYNNDGKLSLSEFSHIFDVINRVKERTVDVLGHFAEATGIPLEVLLNQYYNGVPMVEILNQAIEHANLPSETVESLMPYLDKIEKDGLAFNREIKQLTRKIEQINNNTTDAISAFANALNIPPEDLWEQIDSGVPMTDVITDALSESNMPNEVIESLLPYLDNATSDGLVFNQEIDNLTNKVLKNSESITESIITLAQSLGIGPETLLSDIDNGKPIGRVIEEAIINAQLPIEIIESLLPRLDLASKDGLLSAQDIILLANVTDQLKSTTIESIGSLAEALELPPQDLFNEINKGVPISEVIENALQQANIPNEIVERIWPQFDLANENEFIFNNEIDIITKTINEIKSDTTSQIIAFAHALQLPPNDLFAQLEQGRPLVDILTDAIGEAELSENTKSSLMPLVDKVGKDGLVFNHEIEALTEAIYEHKFSIPEGTHLEESELSKMMHFV